MICMRILHAALCSACGLIPFDGRGDFFFCRTSPPKVPGEHPTKMSTSGALPYFLGNTDLHIIAQHYYQRTKTQFHFTNNAFSTYDIPPNSPHEHIAMCYIEHTSLAPSLHTCVYPYPPATLAFNWLLS